MSRATCTFVELSPDFCFWSVIRIFAINLEITADLNIGGRIAASLALSTLGSAENKPADPPDCSHADTSKDPFVILEKPIDHVASSFFYRWVGCRMIAMGPGAGARAGAWSALRAFLRVFALAFPNWYHLGRCLCFLKSFVLSLPPFDLHAAIQLPPRVGHLPKVAQLLEHHGWVH